MSPELSLTMLNVLDAIVDMTIKLRGKNVGDVKDRIDASQFYESTISALSRRGLIEHKVDTIFGDGWAATPLGFEVWREANAAAKQ